MVTSRGEWDWASFEHLLSSMALLHIAMVRAPCNTGWVDISGWKLNFNHCYTVRSAYTMRIGGSIGSKSIQAKFGTLVGISKSLSIASVVTNCGSAT
ncbi:hypothetical protein V6N11_077196 [Hibiscus sabdariffa]|uniref:Uncharacterized protein n=1 Tax=Hibiscus sabdariffa TaxID=183260 RepID=A0ABR2TCP1_9ROSI